ncbi:MAG: response regulator [Chloroflexi bacterium]|nr:response regulator [Chloroflexota bacterium]
MNNKFLVSSPSNSIECLILPLALNGEEQAYTRVLQDLLKNMGCFPQKMARSAVDAAKIFHTDLILIEVDSLEDLELFHELRSSTKKPIIMYGYGVSSAVWVRGLEYGADGFVSFPEAQEVLAERLKAMLHRAGLEISRN